MCVKPLFKLIDNDQDLLAGWQQIGAAANVRESLCHVQSRIKLFCRLSKATHQPGLSVIRSRLKVDDADMIAESGNESGFRE